MSHKTAPTDLSIIAKPLLCWYHSHSRTLPWRDDPQPYYVWISEIMLQQTRVEAVKPYFERFIAALPTIQALADVPPDKLLKLWEGLGYYNRARNLKRAAVLIMEKYGGRLPADYDELLTLPGIGRYTAGAICSIAYEIPAPAVDGNVLRVISRVLASHDDIMKDSTRRKIEQTLLPAIPKDACRHFNQALMELGAMICLPKGAAKCPECPLKQICLAYDRDIVAELPAKSPKKSRRIEEKTIFRFVYQDKIAFRQRSNRGLLAGMWELPQADGCLTPKDAADFAAQNGLSVCCIKPLEKAKHIFTHMEWHMIGYEITVAALPDDTPFTWLTAQELVDNFAVPTAISAYVFQQSPPPTREGQPDNPSPPAR